MNAPTASNENHQRSNRIWRRLLTNPLGLTSLILLAAIVVVSIFGSLLVTHDPNQVDLAAALGPISAEHLLGTDSAGRDVLSRLIVGTQPTLIAGLIAAGVGIAIGVPSGLIAGFYGGVFDSVATWVGNALLSLPGMIVLLAVRAAVGPSVWILMSVFGVLLAPSCFRVVRAAVRVVRNELFVDAARVSGVSDLSIIGRHVLATVRTPVIIQGANVSGIAIALQSGLEFLGLGDPQVPTWGSMVSEGFSYLYRAPLLFVWPSLAVVLTILAFGLLGNALRDAVEGSTKVASRHRPPEAGAAPAPEPMAEDALLRVEGLSVGFDVGGQWKTVVDGVSFEVRRGQSVGIVGESGSGKTQTAFALLGLLARDAAVLAGQVVFDGVAVAGTGVQGTVRDATRWRGTRIGYVPQEPMSNLDPAFKVGHQLTRPMVKVLGISRADARQRARDLLETVGIADPDRVMDSYPHALSGGMAQRVLIAGAVACGPDLLIADEPTTALDVTVQAEVLDLLRDLRERNGMAVLIVTHNMGVVADLCDRVVVMNSGRVVEAGEVRDVVRSPRSPYTRSLLYSMLHGKPRKTLLTAEVAAS